MNYPEENPLYPEDNTEQEVDPRLTDRLIWKHLLKQGSYQSDKFETDSDTKWEN